MNVGFAEKLARVAEVYVMMLLGRRIALMLRRKGSLECWRPGRTVRGGLLMERELSFLGRARASHKAISGHPGRSKGFRQNSGDRSLLEKADAILIGGAMGVHVFAWLKASKQASRWLKPIKLKWRKPRWPKPSRGVKFLLPLDDVVAIPRRPISSTKRGGQSLIIRTFTSIMTRIVRMKRPVWISARPRSRRIRKKSPSQDDPLERPDGII